MKGFPISKPLSKISLRYNQLLDNPRGIQYDYPKINILTAKREEMRKNTCLQEAQVSESYFQYRVFPQQRKHGDFT